VISEAEVFNYASCGVNDRGEWSQGGIWQTIKHLVMVSISNRYDVEFASRLV